MRTYPVKSGSSGLGRKRDGYTGRAFCSIIPSMSMFCFLFPTLLPRIAAFTAFTQTRHFGALHETTSKAILAAGKETCFRNWINTPFIFFFSFRFVIMNFLPLAIIFVFYLPQGMFKVVFLHQWFLSQLPPRLHLEFCAQRCES